MLSGTMAREVQYAQDPRAAGGRTLGNEDFVRNLEARLKRPLAKRGPGQKPAPTPDPQPPRCSRGADNLSPIRICIRDRKRPRSPHLMVIISERVKRVPRLIRCEAVSVELFNGARRDDQG
jgi:hypothetical protein